MKNEEIKKIIKHYTSDSRYSRCPDKKCKNHNWETLFGIEDSTEINYCDLCGKKLDKKTEKDSIGYAVIGKIIVDEVMGVRA